MNPAIERIHTAAIQLARSERGQQSMLDLLSFIENGAPGLDAENQKAITTLFISSISGFTGTVREAIKTALSEPQRP